MAGGSLITGRLKTTTLFLLAVGMFALIPSTVASAGPAPGLCNYNPVRGVVPSEFPIDACIDGSSVWLRNTLAIPVRYSSTGASGATVVVNLNQTPPAVATRAAFPTTSLLLPGDVVRIPFGSSRSSVSVVGDVAPVFVFSAAKLLATVIPIVGAGVVNAVPAYFVELSNAAFNYQNCIANASNFVARRACEVVLVRDTTFATGRLALAIRFNTGAIKSLLRAQTLLDYAKDAINSVQTLVRSPSTIAISPSIGSGPPPTTGSGALTGMAFRLTFGENSYPLVEDFLTCPAGARSYGGAGGLFNISNITNSSGGWAVDFSRVNDSYVVAFESNGLVIGVGGTVSVILNGQTTGWLTLWAGCPSNPITSIGLGVQTPFTVQVNNDATSSFPTLQSCGVGILRRPTEQTFTLDVTVRDC